MSSVQCKKKKKNEFFDLEIQFCDRFFVECVEFVCDKPTLCISKMVVTPKHVISIVKR